MNPIFIQIKDLREKTEASNYSCILNINAHWTFHRNISRRGQSHIEFTHQCVGRAFLFLGKGEINVFSKPRATSQSGYTCIHVAHGNAIPSENDVYRQTFLCVSSHSLIPQKYHWYHRNQNKKGKRFCKINIYEVNIKTFPIYLNSVDELKLTWVT